MVLNEYINSIEICMLQVGYVVRSRSSMKCSVNSLIQMKSVIYSNSQVGYAVRRPSYYTVYNRNKTVKHSSFFKILQQENIF